MTAKEKLELERAYRDTVYSVFVDGHRYDIKIDQVDSGISGALLALTKSQSGVIMTAWNPRSQRLSDIENKKRNTELAEYLTRHHFAFNSALGEGLHSSWQAEESFFIPDMNKETAEFLAEKFQQYAYVWLDEKQPVSLIFSIVWDN